MTFQGFRAALAAVSGCLLAAVSQAQIIESDWVSSLTGPQNWQVNANWSTATFPNDPGRVDNMPTVVEDVVGANLSVDLANDLNVNVGGTDVTVAGLRLGGTLGAVTTTVSTTGGRLVFENYELNNNTDPDNPVLAYNSGRALIVSGGVAGSTNIISAPIFINRENLDIGSDGVNMTTNDLLISGPITFAGTDFTSSINMEAPGRTLTITSDLVVNDTFTAAENNPPDFAFNGEFNAEAQGTIRMQGNISGLGRLLIGPRSGNAITPVSTIVLSGNNTNTGGISHGRATIVLASDTALGTGPVRQSSNTGTLGANLVSDDDARTIANDFDLSQFVTIKGDHSLTISGDVAQNNSRGFINNLPAGKTLFLTGTQAADGNGTPDPNPIPAGDQPINYDGEGRTVITGALVDTNSGASVRRSFGKRGTGALYLQGSIQATPNVSTYSGFTYVQGGNLHAATVADFGSTQRIRSVGGAVGLDDGTITGPGSAAFLGLLSNRSQAPTHTHPDLRRFDEFSSGGLMLSAAESAVNLDFTSNQLERARDMSVAGPEQGLTYTGTITPFNNTYRLGGGAGVITLPNANQLTGARSVVVTNGHDLGDRKGLGGVRITGNNNYTGATRIEGKWLTSSQEEAKVDGGLPSSQPSAQFNGTTLTVTSLANGGVASGVGASTSAASNLHIQGGTLRYQGAATTTDRLFTIGTQGASIDSSGTGALVFSNTGALTIDTAEARQGTTAGSGVGFGFEAGVTPSSDTVAYLIGDTSDLVPGMEIMGNFLTESSTDDDDVITITSILSPNRVQFSDPLNLFTNFNQTPSTLTFVDVERTFTLTGSNTGNNVLRPVISDSPTAAVNVSKTGSGKWILDGSNTYTGDTSILEGTLGVRDGVGTLAAGTDLNLEAGAALEIEIAGVGNNDLLTITGEATLAGAIDVSLLGGFNPTSGTFDILTAANIVDAGLSIIGDGGFTFNIVGGTTLQLVAGASAGLAGDYNNDGVVDSIDYAVWREALGTSTPLPNDSIGGTIGSAQFNQWRDNYGASNPGSGAVTIPEPTGMLLILLTLGGVCGRRRMA